jgi:solute carrier family 35 protein E1
LMAFAGAIIFVSQNIFSKKLFNESSSTAADPTVPLHRRKLDKLNLLCYSSGIAFLLTVPLWLYSEGFGLMGEYVRDSKIALSGKGRDLSESFPSTELCTLAKISSPLYCYLWFHL